MIADTKPKIVAKKVRDRSLFVSEAKMICPISPVVPNNHRAAIVKKFRLFEKYHGQFVNLHCKKCELDCYLEHTHHAHGDTFNGV